MTENEIQLIANKVIQSLQQERKNREEEIPKIPLQEKHIQNCEILLNRRKLLEKMKQNSIVAEIGVDEGTFSQAIYNITNPKRYHLIDSWGTNRYHEGKYDAVRSIFSSEIENGEVDIHRKLSTDAVFDFEDHYFDWIYIDTDHSYETTRDELKGYAPKMKDNGIIMGHDYVKGNWITTYRYGVIEAVHEFCVNNDWELIYLTAEPTENQSFAIRKIS